MAEQRALSRRQFAASGFDAAGYAFNEEPGEFVATIDCKRWGKKKMVTFFTFEDGRKVVAPTWPNSNYQGLADMPLGAKVRLCFQYTRTGKLNLKGAEFIGAPVQQIRQEAHRQSVMEM